MGKYERRKAFLLSRSERIGIAILLSILMFLFGVRFGIKFHRPPRGQEYKTIFDTITLVQLPPKVDSTSFTSTGKAHTSSPEYHSDYSQYQSKHTPEVKPEEVKYSRFSFDPNTLSRDSLLLLGIPTYAVDNLIKYRDKGGSVKSGDDLFDRIYGFNKVDLDIKRYVDIPNQAKSSSKATRSFKTPILGYHSIHLNNCDTTELKKIPGIGSYFARAILQERDKLGGFHDYDQISTVFLMRSTLIDTIKIYTYIDTESLNTIPLNHVTEEDLARHPYITRKQAMIITRYREHHGPYTDYETLKKIPGIDDEWLARMTPYLSLD